MNATDILNKAALHMADRASTYDKPEGERSMGRAVEAFNAITGRDLSESEGWLLLQVLKSVRLFARPGYHADSAEDGVAYAALVAEAKSVEAVSKAWPDDDRIDAIGQNGATGEHYNGKAKLLGYDKHLIDVTSNGGSIAPTRIVIEAATKES